MCCIARKNECGTCPYNKTCAYAFIFETIIPQENQVAPGTVRASHPFSFSNCSQNEFTITLYGKACDYLPYIYAAFYRASKQGLFKERIPFDITDVKIAEKSILIDEENISTQNPVFEWKYENVADVDTANSDVVAREKELFIELKTPLRFKVQGKYSTDFNQVDFMNCLFRRAKTLCLLYGQFDEGFSYNAQKIEFEMTEKNLMWKDSVHYSARQKRAMELGGACGSFKLKGKFSDFELALIDFAKIFNAGKNTNFGLGQMDYWIR